MIIQVLHCPYCQIPPDLVVNSQAIDIIEFIQSPIGRKNVVKGLGRNRKSRCERLSTSEDYWSTT
jgi:hypothetical protein